ncbi:MAG: DNA methyltransferase [Thermoleophilia bacterium]
MSNRRTRLELTWIGKENRPKLEPRVLIEEPDKSYHAAHRVGEKDIFANRLIFGDNLLALKSLEQEFANQIKCIYIDPPFNTGEMFEHYEDGVEHSLWLSQMRDRLECLHELLAPDGTLFVHIDDNELGYLLAVLDEVFCRQNRLYVITFKQGSATGHKAINPGCVNTTNYVLMYAKEKSRWKPNRVFTGRERDVRYNQFISNPSAHFSEWEITTLMRGFSATQSITESEARRVARNRPEAIDEFVVDHANQVVQLARPNYSGVRRSAANTAASLTKEPSEQG